MRFAVVRADTGEVIRRGICDDAQFDSQAFRPNEVVAWVPEHEWTDVENKVYNFETTNWDDPPG